MRDVSQQINCPECGKLNKIGENFCHNCGTQLKLNETKEPQPNPTQQPQTIVQDQYPTLVFKPEKTRKISNKSIIIIIIAFCLSTSVLITIFFVITAWLW